MLVILVFTVGGGVQAGEIIYVDDIREDVITKEVLVRTADNDIELVDRIYEGDLPSGLESLFTSHLFVRQPDKTYSALAAAKLGDEGGAFAGSLSTSPGIWINQLSDVGLALEPTAKGTKHYRDDDLK